MMTCESWPATESRMPIEPGAVAWTAARLLALHGERGEADRLAERILKPAHGARYLLAGHPARTKHRHDGPRPARKRRTDPA